MKNNSENLDAVILGGDIAYTGFDPRGWDTFFDFLDDYSIFAEVPLMIANGNHGTYLSRLIIHFSTKHAKKANHE